MGTSRDWSVARIELLRWKLLARLNEKLEPALEKSIEKIRKLGHAFYYDSANNRLTKLTPIKPGGSRLSWHIRKLDEILPNPDDHGLSQLATIGLPPKELLEAGDEFMCVYRSRCRYIRWIKKINRQLSIKIGEELVDPKRRSPTILRINGRLYPIARNWKVDTEAWHYWWPDFNEQAEDPFGIVNV